MNPMLPIGGALALGDTIASAKDRHRAAIEHAKEIELSPWTGMAPVTKVPDKQSFIKNLSTMLPDLMKLQQNQQNLDWQKKMQGQYSPWMDQSAQVPQVPGSDLPETGEMVGGGTFV